MSALLWAALGGYLLGSLSFAVITSRLMGLADPRSYGSGNPGATNVLRSGNKQAALLTLLFDALKGFVPAWGVAWLGWGETAAAVAGLASFAGHLWPVFFKFQGGKGVATAAGVVFGLNPWLGLAVLGCFVGLLALTRIVSLASMGAAVAAAALQALVWGPSSAVGILLAMAALLVWRHRANIERLRAGTEPQLGKKKHG